MISVLFNKKELFDVIRFEPQVAFMLNNNSHYTTAAMNIMRSHETAQLFRRCHTAGLDPLLITAQALMETGYIHLGKRTPKDIDFLLKPEEVSRAKGILIGAGYQADHNSTGHYLKRNPFQTFYNIDLHWEFWYLPRPAFRALWSRARIVDVSGTRIKILAPEDHFIYIAIHSLLHHGVLDTDHLTDLTALVEQTPDFDWSHIIRQVKSYRLETPIRLVLEILHQKGVSITSLVFQQIRINSLIEKLEYIIIKNIIQHSPIPEIGYLLKTLGVNGWHGKFYYLATFLFPTRLFMEERYPVKNELLFWWYRFTRPIYLSVQMSRFTLRLLRSFI